MTDALHEDFPIMPREWSAIPGLTIAGQFREELCGAGDRCAQGAAVISYTLVFPLTSFPEMRSGFPVGL